MKNDADYSDFAPEDKTVVKDFVWKLDGRIPDRSASADYGMGYFGASLYFVNLNNGLKMPAGTKVTVTLTPEAGATYLDGTPATADGNKDVYNRQWRQLLYRRHKSEQLYHAASK
jgi:hypothetical protein